jgi:hypothetical protein
MRIAEMTQAALNRRNPEAPLLVKSATGLEVSPHTVIAASAAKQMIHAADRLGFSPGARPRIQIAPEPPDERAGDRFIELNELRHTWPRSIARRDGLRSIRSC